MYFLGIDGGGTTTKGVITDEQGNVIAKGVVGASNPNNVAADIVGTEFKKLFSILESKSNMSIHNVQHIFAGLSGVNRPSDKLERQQFFSSLLNISNNISVDNDAVTALYSGTLGTEGVVQISGTGSITYGINGQGDHARVGGWGHLINEKGSGFTIGQEALNVALDAYDEMNEPTILTQLITDYFDVQTLPDVIHHVYHADNVKTAIAALSKLVFKAADQDDKAAKSIINQQGKEIGQRVACLLKKHFKVEHKFIPVVLAGGVFNRLDLFQEAIEQSIDEHGGSALLTIPKVEPMAGAVIAALKAEHIAVAKESFIENYNSYREG